MRSNSNVITTARFILSLAQLFFIFIVFAFTVTAEAQSPVGYWTFAEGTGTEAADSSGNGYTATLVNGVQWGSSPVGSGIVADAANHQYVSIPPINLAATKGVTIALWVNRTYTTTGGTVLFEATADYRQSTTGFTLLPDDNTCHGLQVGLRGDVGYTSNCYTQPSSGVWHQLAVVFDKTQSGGNQASLYIDGVLQSPTQNLQASTNTNSFGNDPIYVFSRGGISDFGSGMIADLRVYDTALSAAEVQQIGTTTQEQSVAGTVSWQQGFDLRNTQSFVLDPAGSTYTLANTVYPTSFSGTTYGWANPSLVGALNRSTKVDPRLAGINYATNGKPATFYVDLPSSGSYNIAMAMGDAGSSQCKGGCRVQFLDGSTVLATVTSGQIGSGYFYDATGLKWSAAQWPTKNQPKQVTLSGTHLGVLVGTTNYSKNSPLTPLAYLSVTQAASSPDFNISASPSSVIVAESQQGSSTITTTVSGGFNNAISLSASGVPSGTNVSFAPNPVAAPGSGSSNMTIAVGSSTAVGTYSITVTGSGGGVQHSTTVTLTVTAACDFTISASPASVSIAQGSQGGSTVSTTGSGGFNNSISLSASGAPSGTTVSFGSNPIGAPGSGTSTMTIAVGSSTAAGTYSITVTGSGGGIQHTTSVTLTVTTPDFAISAAPASVSIAQGSQGGSTVSTTGSGGFNNSISLSASGAPSGTTVSFGSNPIAAPGSGTSTMTIAVGSSTAAGTYSITVTGSGGGIQHSTSVTLTVTTPNFAISAAPASVSVAQGSQGSSTVSTTVTGGFTNSISLSASGVPTGTTVSFGSNPIAAPGSGTSTMTIAVGSSTAAGTYSIVVTGSGGGIQHSTTVSLTVTGTVSPQVGLSWTASPPPVSGYNVYRSAVSGGPYTKLNTGLISNTSYTDFNVLSGYTYYYVSTAVDSQGMESAYSNEASATVP